MPLKQADRWGRGGAERSGPNGNFLFGVLGLFVGLVVWCEVVVVCGFYPPLQQSGVPTLKQGGDDCRGHSGVVG